MIMPTNVMLSILYINIDFKIARSYWEMHDIYMLVGGKVELHHSKDRPIPFDGCVGIHSMCIMLFPLNIYIG